MDKRLDHLKPHLDSLWGQKGPYRELIALSALGYEDVVTEIVDDFTIGTIAEFLEAMESEETESDTTAVCLLKDLHDTFVHNQLQEDQKQFYVFTSGRIIKIDSKTVTAEGVQMTYFCHETNDKKIAADSFWNYEEFSFITLQEAQNQSAEDVKELYRENKC